MGSDFRESLGCRYPAHRPAKSCQVTAFPVLSLEHFQLSTLNFIHAGVRRRVSGKFQANQSADKNPAGILAAKIMEQIDSGNAGMSVLLTVR